MPKLSEISEEFNRLKKQKQSIRNELYPILNQLHEAQNARANVAEVLGMKFDGKEKPVEQHIFPRKRDRE